MKLSPTQIDVLRRLERGDVLRWASCGPFWRAGKGITKEATLTALRKRRLVELSPNQVGTSREVVLSELGRAWLGENHEKV